MSRVGQRNDGSFRVALLWSYAMGGGYQLITAAVTLVLAKLLTPEHFGVLAMASVFIAMVQLVLDQGVSAALIQRPGLKPGHVHSTFWANVTLGLILMGITMALAGPWATANKTPELKPVLLMLSLVIPMQSLSVVQAALLQRTMQFKELAIRGQISALAGGLVGISAAFAGAEVWSLVWQQLVSVAIGTILLWRAGKYRPRMFFVWRRLREILGYSLWVLGAKTGRFLAMRSDALIAGLMFGPVSVGIYRLADRLVDMGVQISAKAIQTAAFPKFSALMEDEVRLSECVDKSLRLNVMVTAPVVAMVAAVSGSAMTAIGPQWSEGANALLLLSLAGLAKATTLVSGPLVNASGHPKFRTLAIWVGAVMSVGLLTVTGFVFKNDSVQDQARALAVVRLLVLFLVSIPFGVWFIQRWTLLKASVPIGISLKGLAVWAAGAGAGQMVELGIPGQPIWLRLGCSLALGTICVALAFWIVFRLDITRVLGDRFSLRNFGKVRSSKLP